MAMQRTGGRTDRASVVRRTQGATHEDCGREMPVRRGSDRSFGLVMAVASAVVGVWPLLHGGVIREPWLAAAGAVLLVAFVRPSILRLPNRAWTALGLLIGRFVGPIVLAILYYVVVTPFALLWRAFGQTPPALRPEAQPSYWILREPGPAPETMRDQF